MWTFMVTAEVLRALNTEKIEYPEYTEVYLKFYLLCYGKESSELPEG